MVTLAHHWDCMEFHEEEVSQSFICLHCNVVTLVYALNGSWVCYNLFDQEAL